jgi:hypothetical protein
MSNITRRRTEFFLLRSTATYKNYSFAQSESLADVASARIPTKYKSRSVELLPTGLTARLRSTSVASHRSTQVDRIRLSHVRRPAELHRCHAAHFSWLQVRVCVSTKDELATTSSSSSSRNSGRCRSPSSLFQNICVMPATRSHQTVGTHARRCR